MKHLILMLFLLISFDSRSQENIDSLPSYQMFILNDSLRLTVVGDSLNYKDYGCLTCVHVIVDKNFNEVGRIYLSVAKNGDIEYLRYYENGKIELQFNQKGTNSIFFRHKSIGFRTKRGKWKVRKL